MRKTLVGVKFYFTEGSIFIKGLIYFTRGQILLGVKNTSMCGQKKIQLINKNKNLKIKIERIFFTQNRYSN
jgi:hypothetical protein